MRMERHHANGLAVAKFLEKDPNVEFVFHPLLPSHPQHEKAVEQQHNKHCGMVFLALKGTHENARTFIRSLKVSINPFKRG